MGTAMKLPVPDQVKPSFVIFDIRALRRSALNTRAVSMLTLPAKDARCRLNTTSTCEIDRWHNELLRKPGGLASGICEPAALE